MNTRSEPIDRPPESLAGPGALRALQRFVLATRPAFFTASALPVAIGAARAYAAQGRIDGAAFGLAVAATVLAHAAVNVYNDVGDDTIGADQGNTLRIYPYTGGSRFIQCGLLSRDAMRRLAIVLAALAALAGALLAVNHGTVVIAMGLAGLALGFLYSMPGIQLSARGLGEPAVGIGLGALPAAGAAWLLSGRLDAAALVLSVPVSAWVTAILLVNEVPDQDSDARAGKRTLVVRYGIGGARWIYAGLTALALAANLVAVAMRALPPWFAIVAVGLAALGAAATAGIGSPVHQRDRLRGSVEKTLGIHAIGCLATIAALVVPRWLS